MQSGSAQGSSMWQSLLGYAQMRFASQIFHGSLGRWAPCDSRTEWLRQGWLWKWRQKRAANVHACTTFEGKTPSILRQKSWKIGRAKSILWSRPLNWLEPTVLMCHDHRWPVSPRFYPDDVIWLALAQTALDNFVHYTFCYFPVFYVIKAPGSLISWPRSCPCPLLVFSWSLDCERF